MRKYNCTLRQCGYLYYVSVIAETDEHAREMAEISSNEKWPGWGLSRATWNVSVVESNASGPARVLSQHAEMFTRVSRSQLSESIKRKVKDYGPYQLLAQEAIELLATPSGKYVNTTEFEISETEFTDTVKSIVWSLYEKRIKESSAENGGPAARRSRDAARSGGFFTLSTFPLVLLMEKEGIQSARGPSRFEPVHPMEMRFSNRTTAQVKSGSHKTSGM